MSRWRIIGVLLGASGLVVPFVIGKLWLNYCTSWQPWLAIIVSGATPAVSVLIAVLVKKNIDQFKEIARYYIGVLYRLAVVLILIELVLFSFFRPVRVVLTAGEGSVTVLIGKVGTDKPVSRSTEGGAPYQQAVYAWHWSTVEREISVLGFPRTLKVTLSPLPTTLRVPDDFLAPVLGVHPRSQAMPYLRMTDLAIAIDLNGKEIDRIDNYTGQFLWIGCDTHVPIPDQWPKYWPKRYAAFWQDPANIRSVSLVELEAGQQVTVRVIRMKDGGEVSRKTFDVKPVTRDLRFRQQGEFDVVDN